MGSTVPDGFPPSASSFKRTIATQNWEQREKTLLSYSIILVGNFFIYVALFGQKGPSILLSTKCKENRETIANKRGLKSKDLHGRRQQQQELPTLFRFSYFPPLSICV